MIPLSENYLRRLLTEWVPHDNAGRPHMSLGPGIPQPPHVRLITRPILGGLQHEYTLAEQAA
jgi:putative transposase